MAFSGQMTRSRLLLRMLLVGVWLMLALPVAAQTGSVQVIDPDDLIGGRRGDVEQAAQQLAGEGADVIVVAVGQSGAAGSNPERVLFDVLDQNNISTASSGHLPNQIIFYVNTVQQYTGLYYGSRWRDRLDPVYQQIIDQQITPQASAGNVAVGMIDGITAVRNTINPPTPRWMYVLAGLVALALIGLVATPLVTRRLSASAALSAAREQAAQARREAGTAIADLAPRMDAARAKAQYDALSYAPDDAQRVQALQRKADQAFNEAQIAFNTAEEQSRLNQNMAIREYERLAVQYVEARNHAKHAKALLEEVEQLRATFDAHRTSA